MKLGFLCLSKRTFHMIRQRFNKSKTQNSLRPSASSCEHPATCCLTAPSHRTEFKLELQVAHLRQGHQKWNVALLDAVKLCGLNCVLLVVHAHDQLLRALKNLRRLGVGKGKKCLSHSVPNATARLLVKEVHEVLRSRP